MICTYTYKIYIPIIILAISLAGALDSVAFIQSFLYKAKAQNLLETLKFCQKTIT